MMLKYPYINWTLWVYAKLRHFRKRQKQFSYSADVKPTENKNQFDFIHWLHSLCVYHDLYYITINSQTGDRPHSKTFPYIAKQVSVLWIYFLCVGLGADVRLWREDEINYVSNKLITFRN